MATTMIVTEAGLGGSTVQAGTLPARDRSRLASLTSMRTGVPQAEAGKRVDEAFQEARNAGVNVRAAAVLVGRHRDEQTEICLFGTRHFC